MLSLSGNNQTDIIEAFNSTSRYLDDLLILIILILNKWYVRYIPLNFSLKSEFFCNEAPFLDLNLSITKQMA